MLNEGKSNQDSSESDLEGSVCEEEPPSQEDGDANASEDGNLFLVMIFIVKCISP